MAAALTPRLPNQEKEALAAELAEVAQRQRAKIGALARERAELAARPAADPGQLEALRREAATLQERLASFTAAKVGSPARAQFPRNCLFQSDARRGISLQLIPLHEDVLPTCMHCSSSIHRWGSSWAWVQ
jgi:hypothetical protein